MDIIQIDPHARYFCSNFTISSGFTSLMYLVNNTRNHPEYLDQIKYILDNYPEELNKQNNIRWTALMITSINSNSTSTSTLDTVKLLLKYNPDLELRSLDGWTALSFTIYNIYSDSSIETMNLLLYYGANINIQNRYGFTILIELVHYKKIDEIKYVLENTNIDINIKNIWYKNAYDHAVEYNYEKAKELLYNYMMNSSLDIKCALD